MTLRAAGAASPHGPAGAEVAQRPSEGRELSFDDILHYQKIIVALCETDRIMQAIDKIEFL